TTRRGHTVTRVPCEPRVLLDATAVPPDRGGVGRYVDSLVAALDTAGTRLAVACQPGDAGHYEQLAPHATVVAAGAAVGSRPVRLGWEQTVLPRLANKLGADVVHSPHYNMPLAHRGASVVTLHDATFFTMPELHGPLKARFFRAWTRVSLRQANACVVPSRATAHELSTAGGSARSTGDTATVTPVAHGVDTERFHPPTRAETAAVRESLHIGDNGYVAFLGALEPRKNVPTLIRGFVAAVADMPAPPALVLAGPSGWDPGVDDVVDSVPSHILVSRVGYLPSEQLAGFLGGADVVAYHSLGGGVGLPVLEHLPC